MTLFSKVLKPVLQKDVPIFINSSLSNVIPYLTPIKPASLESSLIYTHSAPANTCWLHPVAPLAYGPFPPLEAKGSARLYCYLTLLISLVARMGDGG